MSRGKAQTERLEVSVGQADGQVAVVEAIRVQAKVLVVEQLAC